MQTFFFTPSVINNSIMAVRGTRLSSGTALHALPIDLVILESELDTPQYLYLNITNFGSLNIHYIVHVIKARYNQRSTACFYEPTP